MWLYSRFKNMARKPIGFLGKIMVRKLNGERHAVLADWGFSHLKVPENADCLDCGCGGGANIRRLLGMTKGRVFGADFSKVAVAETKKFNKSDVKSGRCQVFLADVKKLPFEDDSLDVVTAFETIYYWENLTECFKEILRVLKNCGVFMITNEAAGRIPENFEWEKQIPGLKIHTGVEIRAALESAGFSEIAIEQKAFGLSHTFIEILYFRDKNPVKKVFLEEPVWQRFHQISGCTIPDKFICDISEYRDADSDN